MKIMVMAGATLLLLAPHMAAAQGQQSSGRQQQASPQQDRQQVAQSCLDDLQSFREQARDDGLWLNGYRTGYGWPSSSAAMRRDQTAARTAPGLGNIDDRSGPEARARAADTQAQGGGAIGTPAPTAMGRPWGNTGWSVPPMQELRTLHDGAVVLARRGEAQACQTVLGELREAYGQYGEQLRQAGADAGRISGYRRQQLAAARPVGELGGALRSDNITGTDVRNPRDEYLGSVEDVVFNPNNGQISHLILAHGGFLGIGEDYIAVPWQRLRATPDLDLFVLNASEQTLEDAPTVDVDAFSNAQTYDQRRQEIDRFWQQQQQERGRAG